MKGRRRDSDEMYRQLDLVIYRRFQARAHSRVMWLIKNGDIPRLPDGVTKCSDCPRPATGYDHRDYRRPSVIDPICVRCNFRRGPAPLDPVRLAYDLSCRDVLPPGFDPRKVDGLDGNFVDEGLPPLWPPVGDPGRGSEEVSQLQERAAPDQAAETTGLT